MTPSDWLERRVLVCVGTGGVGKTTVSAALGIEAARRGKRALVLTIDPARRLADALGTGALDHEEREVPGAASGGSGSRGDGALFAMMLDTKRTFDEVVRRYARDAETLEKIFANPINQNLTDALAGSREYSAMEQLHRIYERGDYDLIVLDTPPARHALDFLEAPRRLTGLFDTQLLRLLFRPAVAMGRTGFRLFQLGASPLLRALERISGFEFLTAVSEFLLVFESMVDGFNERARATEQLLRGPQCGFLLVAGPDPPQVRRAHEFFGRLRQERISVEGLVVNRVRRWRGSGAIPDPDAEERTRAIDWLAGGLAARGIDAAGAAAREIVETAVREAALARRDAAAVTELRQQLPLDSPSVRVVPLLAEDIHALDGLSRIAAHLFGEPARG